MNRTEPPQGRLTVFTSMVMLAVIAAFVLAGAGPLLDAWDADKAQRAVAADAARKQAARERFERAAHEICGWNAGWQEVAPGQVQCYRHTGQKTALVRIGD